MPSNLDYPPSRIQARPRRPSLFDALALRLIQLFVCFRLSTHSPQTANAVRHAFASFEKYLYSHKRWRNKGKRSYSIVDVYEPSVVSGYVSYAVGTVNGSHLREFYKWGLNAGYKGFDEKTLRRLRALKFVGRDSSDRSFEWHRTRGALQWEEAQQIRLAIERGAGADRDRAVVQLFYETMIRPEQAEQLRRSHLHSTPNTDRWRLAAPKGKPRHATSENDDKFISSSLAELLLRVSENGPGKDPFLFYWLTDGAAVRDVTAGLRDAVKQWGKDANIVRAEGKKSSSLLPLTPYRFRRHGPTEMANDGASEDEIALRLGHSTTHTARRYVQESSHVVEVLRATLDRHPLWCRILNLFAGSLLSDDRDSRLPVILGTVPHFTPIWKSPTDVKVVGRCANPKKCILYPPLSCYTCPYFRASTDERAHKMLLDQMGNEVDRLIGLESDRMATAMLPYMAAIVSAIAKIREEIGLVPEAQKSAASAAIYRRKD
jgi:integrase